MASSNRHWPSLFKSKPACNNQQWPQPHDVVSSHHHPSLLSNSCSRSSSSTFSSGCEERSPEPKPRWNPKPEQIRILEAIFNSGMVNPPRDEIRRIRAQLQEYGQVGDANVFYWFQNRKSRSKHKQRSLQAAAAAKTTASAASPPMTTASSSSSTASSDKGYSPKRPKSSSGGGGGGGGGGVGGGGGNSNNSSGSINNQFGNSPTSVNQQQCSTYFHHQLVGPPNHDHQFLIGGGGGQEYFPLHQSGAAAAAVVGPFSQGLCFGDGVVASVPSSDHGCGGGGGGGGGGAGCFSTLLLGEMIGGGGGGESKREEVEKLKFQQELSFMVTNNNNNNNNGLNTSSNINCTIPCSSSTIHTPSSCGISTGLGHILGLGEAGGMPAKSMVFIDNLAIEVPMAPFNVKEAFGDDAILVHPTGHPVLTNEWGVTLQPLQNGAFYYLVRSAVAASPLLDKLDTTPDLLASEFPYQI